MLPSLPPPAAPPPVSPVDPWAARPFVLEGQFGIGAPLGFAGLAVDYSPIPPLALNLGAGIDRAGVQFAFSTRLRVGRFDAHDHVMLYVGAGASVGPYDSPIPNPLPNLDFGAGGNQEFPQPPPPHDHWGAAYWANPETGFDMRLGPQVSLKIFAGVSFLLNRTPSLVVLGPPASPPTNVTNPWLPYLGLALGAAL